MTLIDEQFDLANLSMAEVALNFPQALPILQRYNLDYCCGGKKSFTDVCRKAGLNPVSVWAEIRDEVARHGADNRMNFSTWDVSLIIDFILQHHHEYVRSSIPQIKELLDKVCNAHGNDNPDLFLIRENFSDLADELIHHMPKEEEILFPAIRELYNSKQASRDLAIGKSHLTMPIAVMEHEHDAAGTFIKNIRSLTSNYTAPGYACPTFKMTYIMLKEFDNDLMQHIHIENNILFPKAKQEIIF